jgi:hypothetical protein
MSRPNLDGSKSYFIQDLRPQDYEFSVSFPLGTEPVLEVSMDQITEVFAVRDATKLRVYRRQRWKDRDGFSTIRELSHLALTGRFQQLELAANDLKSSTRLRGSFGASLYMNLTSQIGKRWADLDNATQSLTQDRRESLNKLEKWRSSRSELSVLASAFRQYNISQRAYGFGWSNAGSQDSWTVDKLLDEIQPLLKEDRPSLPVLRLACLATLQKQENFREELQPLIKRQVELYPFSTVNLVSLCTQLLPNASGSPGECGAYLEVICDLLPSPLRDEVYTFVAASVLRTIHIGDRVTPTQTGISVNRILRSVEPLLEGDPSQFDVEFVLKFALKNNRTDIAGRAAVYHVENFALVGLSDDETAKKLLLKTRDDLFKEYVR